MSIRSSSSSSNKGSKKERKGGNDNKEQTDTQKTTEKLKLKSKTKPKSKKKETKKEKEKEKGKGWNRKREVYSDPGELLDFLLKKKLENSRSQECDNQQKDKKHCKSQCPSFAASVIFRPEGPDDFPYVSTWSQVKVVVKCAKGNVLVQWDNTYQNPIVFTVEMAGSPFDGQFRTWFSSSIKSQHIDLQFSTPFPPLGWLVNPFPPPPSLLSSTSTSTSTSTSSTLPLKLNLNLNEFQKKAESKKSKSKSKKKQKTKDLKAILKLHFRNKETKTKTKINEKIFISSKSTSPPLATPVIVEVQDGVVFQNLLGIDGIVGFRCEAITKSPFVWTKGDILFVLKNGATIMNHLNASLPLISPVAGTSFTLLMETGANLDNSTVPGVPILRITDSSILIIAIANFSNITENSVGDDGTGFALYNFDASSSFWNNPISFTGLNFQGTFDTSSRVGYDDFAQQPILVTSPPPYGATVQLTLDALKSQLFSSNASWNPNPVSGIVEITVSSSESYFNVNANSSGTKSIHLSTNFLITNSTGGIVTEFDFTFTLPGTGNSLNVGVGGGSGLISSTGAPVIVEQTTVVNTNQTLISTKGISFPDTDTILLAFWMDFQIN